MKIAVTGGSGHLGVNVIRQLLDEGKHSVRVLTLEPVGSTVPSLEGLDVERVQGNICDPESIAGAFDGMDVVFHLAGRISIVQWDDKATWKVNVEGTRNVVDEALIGGVRRLVYTSSIQALSPFPMRQAVVEERAMANKRLTNYDKTKIAGEKIVRSGIERGLEAVILNPTGLVGPYDMVPSLIGQTLLELFAGRLPAMINGGSNWVDVRDVAAAAIAAATNGRNGERYIVGGAWVRNTEMAEIAAKVAGVRPPRFNAPLWIGKALAPIAATWYRVAKRTPRWTPISMRALERYRLVLDNRAWDELGHRSRRIEETIKDTYDWFCEAGMLDPSTLKLKQLQPA